jgi:hypothetical protein
MTMICQVCRDAADSGKHGYFHHNDCKSLELVTIDCMPRWVLVNPTMCDCQHKEPVGR